MYPPLKHHAVRFEIPFQIVALTLNGYPAATQNNQSSACGSLQHLQTGFVSGHRVRPGNTVAEINQLTARFPGNTPVRNLWMALA